MHSIRSGSRRGVALVIVLAFLVIILGLAVAFLSRTSLERSSSAGYAAASTTRQLADMTVSLVQGQIRDATTQGSDVAWASQPGMVRTFNTAGTLKQAYKLYSATEMISSALSFDPSGKLTEDYPVNSWASDLAVWTDLNAPVTVGGGVNYPILDPGTSLNPSTVAGFALTSPPLTGTTNPAPMPVRWLYVLKDGSMEAPAGSGRTATIAAATTDNPIVGRVTFWTDDETCKVNVNTAGEGTYWDTPRANTDQEKLFADRQPVLREFQRYPGHPATTSLSAVFPGLSADQIFGLIPRINGGGSNAGTAQTTPSTPPVTLDSDRLYASVDELVFSATSRGTNAAGLTKSQLEQAKFFLSTNSRAPEVNLFNLPRIACWPINKDLLVNPTTTPFATPFDKVIAFCSTINGQPYYFQRETADSPTNDIGIARNGELFAYLQNLTSRPVPGFGSDTFSGKYPGGDRDQILTEIFDYIRSTNLADDNLAADKRFTDSAGAGRGWVVPTIQGTSMGFGRTLTLSALSIGFICNASVDEDTESNDPVVNKVLGGAPLAAHEKYIQAIIVPEFFSVMQGWAMINPDMQVEITGLENLTVTTFAADGSTQVTQNLFPPAANAAIPFRRSPGDYWDTRAWGGSPGWRYFGMRKGAPERGNLASDAVPGSGDNAADSLYPFIGNPIKIRDTAGAMDFSGGDVTVKFYAGATTVPGPATLVQTLKLHLPERTFPTPKIVTSDKGGVAKRCWWAFSQKGIDNNDAHPGRLFHLNSPVSSQGSFFRSGFDVVRSILPRHGDFRLIAATRELNDPTNAVFVPHPSYGNSIVLAANSFGGIDRKADIGDFAGKYISGLTYSKYYAPLVPSNAVAADRPESTGDYDTGGALVADGAYINKPDEGNTYRGNPVNLANVPYFFQDQAQSSNLTFFTPNRIMPSPGMFGSLPSGVKAAPPVPWRTLLFRPQPTHFGAATLPKDHLLLDLFWMPVVEPYAISDPFSTVGKINMNYQLLPFTYIERSTGLQAILKSEKVASIPNANVANYKTGVPAGVFRLDVNIPETLSQFADKFKTGDIFKSASEICDIHIVPSDGAAATMSTYWTSRQLTGDNLRERIYTTIYPRLTTKSNTYTVHYKVQALKKTSASATVWDEDKDKIVGEYRGSTTIERYINPNDSSIPNYGADPTAAPDLGFFYKWRVLNTRQFAP